MQEFFEKENEEFLQWLKRRWNIEFKCVRPEIDIQGSPERTLSRMVFQDRQDSLFLIEKISEKKFNLRQNIANAIEYLKEHGLKQALSYQKTINGEFLPFFKNAHFQITPFLDSTCVKRPEYLSSSVMGKSFAVFLTHLSSASHNIERKIPFNFFSIKKYIYKLFKEMKIHDPVMVKKFHPFLIFLEKEFMGIHDQLPGSFCHGDLHPLNVIWNQDRIKAVIDWEFTGMKPDIYDAANLVGCAGIEDPNGLGMPMVMTFLRQMRHNNIFSELGWQFFPEYVLALRFAWLSEWLRRKDTQMLEMEEAYMWIIVNHIDTIRQGWKIKRD